MAMGQVRDRRVKDEVSKCRWVPGSGGRGGGWWPGGTVKLVV